MNELTRNKTSFTGVYGGEKMKLLRDINGCEKWDIYRKEYEDLSNLSYVFNLPIQVDFELNATCNLSCPMCPLSVEVNSEKKDFLLPFSLFKQIIDEGVANNTGGGGGVKSIRLNYLNEPLLRNDLEQFIIYAKQKGILDVYFSTNGFLLTKQRAKSLIESKLDRIQISLDANSKELYDKMRPGSDFDRVVSNVLNLIELKKELKSITPLVRVNFVRTELNEHELEEFINFWKDKADMIGVQEMVKPPRSKIEIKSKTTEKKGTDFKCSFPYKNLVINAQGNVLPCCTFYGDEMPLGNVFEFLKSDKSKSVGILEHFFNLKSIKELRELHKNSNYEKHKLCKKCVEGSLYQ